MKKFLVLTIYLFLFAGHVHADNPWQRELKAYFAKSKTSFLTQLHYYTYLYVAQNDVGTPNENVLNAIAFELTRRLFPDFTDLHCMDLFCHAATLKQTQELKEAQEIVAPYIERLNREKMNTHTFPTPCWFRKNPEYVEQVAHWIPWNRPLPTTPPPPTANNHKAWGIQFQQLRETQSHLTDYEIASVHKWAQGKGCCWYTFANDFMEKQRVPIKKILLVRSVLMQGLYDGMIAEYEAKYAYCVPRPGYMDPTFKPLLSLDSPSYPSGHAIQGTITALILSSFFPESSSYWQQLAQESSNSRLWAGVHFPEDITQGEIIGKKIAEQTLRAHNGESACALLEQAWKPCENRLIEISDQEGPQYEGHEFQSSNRVSGKEESLEHREDISHSPHNQLSLYRHEHPLIMSENSLQLRQADICQRDCQRRHVRLDSSMQWSAHHPVLQLPWQ